MYHNNPGLAASLIHPQAWAAEWVRDPGRCLAQGLGARGGAGCESSGHQLLPPPLARAVLPAALAFRTASNSRSYASAHRSMLCPGAWLRLVLRILAAS